MSKLIGKRKSEYLAEVVCQDTGLDTSVASRLTERLDGAIRSLRTTKAQRAQVKSKSGAPPLAESASNRFDPYAFNAILILKRSGRDALKARLSEIGDVTHLRQLAEAQLIGLDQDMRAGPVAIEELREAVLRGVERLVADRRAAAS